MSFDKHMMRALRDAGFTRAWLTQHQDGDVVQYERWDETRLIEVQLCESGGHRASNMLIIENDRRRLAGTTPPTYFNNVEDMMGAILHEAARKDHKREFSSSTPTELTLEPDFVKEARDIIANSSSSTPMTWEKAKATVRGYEAGEAVARAVERARAQLTKAFPGIGEMRVTLAASDLETLLATIHGTKSEGEAVQYDVARIASLKAALEAILSEIYGGVDQWWGNLREAVERAEALLTSPSFAQPPSTPEGEAVRVAIAALAEVWALWDQVDEDDRVRRAWRVTVKVNTDVLRRAGRALRALTALRRSGEGV